MFVGLPQDNMFIRLSEKDSEKVFATHEGIHPFEPMKGRTMKKYAVVSKSLYTDQATFEELMQLSYQYVASLPPKTPKKKTS